MNNQPLLTISGSLTPEAVRILRDIPGVQVETPRASHSAGPDVVLRAGGVTKIIQLRSVRRGNAAAAAQLINQTRDGQSDQYWVLVAPSITDEAQEMLTEAEIGFLDTTGAMIINVPGIFVWRDRQRQAHPGAGDRAADRLPRLTGKAGRVTQCLLTDPAGSWKVNELASAAGVSIGLAHSVFARLEAENLVETVGAGPSKTRRISHPTALLDLWAEETTDRGVRARRGYRLSRDPRKQAAALSATLTGLDINHAVTGAAAAARLAPFITTVPVTEVWVPELQSLDEVAASTGVSLVDEGHNILLRQAAGDAALMLRSHHEGVWLANPFRVYVDLRADPRRGREQAARLRAEVIGF